MHRIQDNNYHCGIFSYLFIFLLTLLLEVLNGLEDFLWKTCSRPHLHLSEKRGFEK